MPLIPSLTSQWLYKMWNFFIFFILFPNSAFGEDRKRFCSYDLGDICKGEVPMGKYSICWAAKAILPRVWTWSGFLQGVFVKASLQFPIPGKNMVGNLNLKEITCIFLKKYPVCFNNLSKPSVSWLFEHPACAIKCFWDYVHRVAQKKCTPLRGPGIFPDFGCCFSMDWIN